MNTRPNPERNHTLSSQFQSGALALACLIGVVAAHAGGLRIGDPLVEDGRFTFPVTLSGGADQVTALDFRFDYDPAVFQPISAAGGVMAIQAGKVVNANVTSPGAYRVVMMGLNQTAVGEGEVARIVLQRLGTDTAETSRLGIGDPTLATGGGGQIDAQGDARDIDFRNPTAPREDTDAGGISDPADDVEEESGVVPDENMTESSEQEPEPGSVVAENQIGMPDSPEAGDSDSGLAGDTNQGLRGEEARNSTNSINSAPDDTEKFGNTEQKSGIAESATAGLELDISGDTVARLGGRSGTQPDAPQPEASNGGVRTNVAAVMVDAIPANADTVESSQSHLLTPAQDSPAPQASGRLTVLATGVLLVIMVGSAVLWRLRKRLFD